MIALLQATPAAVDAEDAIRRRARALINEVQSVFVWEGPPFDLIALASYRGFQVIMTGGLAPSQDACIIPGLIAINSSKPPRRRRYSLAHEISHTLFPDYDDTLRSAGKLWRDARKPMKTDAANVELERLCDIGASELLLPEFAFRPLLLADGLSLDTVVRLSTLFDASLEATCRRATDITHERAMTLVVQPWDTETGKPTREYAPRASLRVARSFPSRASSNWTLRSGTQVPTTSVASKAWMRAPFPTLGIDLHTASEVWPTIDTGADASETLECHAMTLPYRAKAPSEVLVLLRQL